MENRSNALRANSFPMAPSRSRVYVTSASRWLEIGIRPALNFENIIRKIATRDTSMRHCCAALDECTHLSGGNILWRKTLESFFACCVYLCFASRRTVHPSMRHGIVSGVFVRTALLGVSDLSSVSREVYVNESVCNDRATPIFNWFDKPKNKAVRENDYRETSERAVEKVFRARHFANCFCETKCIPFVCVT